MSAEILQIEDEIAIIKNKISNFINDWKKTLIDSKNFILWKIQWIEEDINI